MIKYHSQIPYLRKLPAPVIGIIFTLIVVNLICWAGVGVVLVGSDDDMTYGAVLLIPPWTG